MTNLLIYFPSLSNNETSFLCLQMKPGLLWLADKKVKGGGRWWYMDNYFVISSLSEKTENSWTIASAQLASRQLSSIVSVPIVYRYSYVTTHNLPAVSSTASSQEIIERVFMYYGHSGMLSSLHGLLLPPTYDTYRERRL